MKNKILQALSEYTINNYHIHEREYEKLTEKMKKKFSLTVYIIKKFDNFIEFADENLTK